MQIAIKSNQRISPEPGIKDAVCELCNGDVIPACGSVNIWHFRHNNKKQDCDSWYEPISEWHLSWQNKFKEEFREVVVNKDGVKHRADIMNSKGTVVEFQNSPISVDEVRKREEFYGNMVWVFNSEMFISSIQTNQFYMLKDPFDNICKYNPKLTKLKRDKQVIGFSWPYRRRKYILNCKKPVFICLQNGLLLWINFFYKDLTILPFRNNIIPRYIKTKLGSIYISDPDKIPHHLTTYEIISSGIGRLYKTKIQTSFLKQIIVESGTGMTLFYPAMIVPKEAFINHYNF